MRNENTGRSSGIMMGLVKTSKRWSTEKLWTRVNNRYRDNNDSFYEVRKEMRKEDIFKGRRTLWEHRCEDSLICTGGRTL